MKMSDIYLLMVIGHQSNDFVDISVLSKCTELHSSADRRLMERMTKVCEGAFNKLLFLPWEIR